VAVRKSLAERARTGQRVRQLENLLAEGKAVADPEDDKLWLSLESKHHLLEFDYARWARGTCRAVLVARWGPTLVQEKPLAACVRGLLAGVAWMLPRAMFTVGSAVLLTATALNPARGVPQNFHTQ
jgi:hypothetical protein